MFGLGYYLSIFNTIADGAQWVANTRLAISVVHVTGAIRDEARPHVERAINFAKSQAGSLSDKAIKRIAPDLYRQYEDETSRSQILGQSIAATNATFQEVTADATEKLAQVAPDADETVIPQKIAQTQAQIKAKQRHRAKLQEQRAALVGELNLMAQVEQQRQQAKLDAAVQLNARLLAKPETLHAANLRKEEAADRETQAQHERQQVNVALEAINDPNGQLMQGIAQANTTHENAVRDLPRALRKRDKAIACKDKTLLANNVQDLVFKAAKKNEKIIILITILDRLTLELESQKNGVEEIIEKIKARDMIAFGKSEEDCAHLIQESLNRANERDNRVEDSCLTRDNWASLSALSRAASVKLQVLNQHKAALTVKREIFEAQINLFAEEVSLSPETLSHAMNESQVTISNAKGFIHDEKVRYSALIDFLIDQSFQNAARLENLSSTGDAVSTLLAAVALIGGTIGAGFLSEWWCRYVTRQHNIRSYGISPTWNTPALFPHLESLPTHFKVSDYASIASVPAAAVVVGFVVPVVWLICSAIAWSKTNQQIEIEGHLKQRLQHEKERIARLFSKHLNHV